MVEQFPNDQSWEVNLKNIKQLLCWIVSAESIKTLEYGPCYTQFSSQMGPVFQTRFLLVQHESHLANDIWITVEQIAHQSFVIQRGLVT